MFKHEVAILKDTFGRLLRRGAKTNLIKLISKTHPADLAIVFRHFDDDQKTQVFELMKNNEHTLQFLIELDDTLMQKVLNQKLPEQIAKIIKSASTNDQSYVLNALEDIQSQSVIELLDTEEKEEIEEFMSYPEDSAGALMTTDIFTLHQMAGGGKDREILLKSPFENAQSRAPWILASLIGGICAAAIISYFNNLLEQIIVLAAFIPVIIGMGGNIGTQSSTIVVRGMATGRIGIGNELKILYKEIRVGLILGVLYGIMLGVFANFKFIGSDPMIGLVIGLSICCSMLIATIVGALTPLILRKLDIDPAIATGPFVTTSIDVLGVLFYFIIAASLLTI